MYALCVSLGILAALVVWRLQPASSAVPDRVRGVVQLAAVIGAILGAHLLQWPATLGGWTVAEPGAHWHPLAGRTVLGGLLGGWLAVEIAKRIVGHRGPTGDGFAAPLAAALALGRLGCLLQGCCAGQVCQAWYALRDTDGVLRLPVQLIESVFHATACAVLLLAAKGDRQAGRRLAWYLLAYAALRFVLEWLRTHPPMLLGLTWYQLLAVALAVLAGTTLWYRRPARISVPG